jgi:hypothetical protein
MGRIGKDSVKFTPNTAVRPGELTASIIQIS